MLGSIYLPVVLCPVFNSSIQSVLQQYNMSKDTKNWFHEPEVIDFVWWPLNTAEGLVLGGRFQSKQTPWIVLYLAAYRSIKVPVSTLCVCFVVWFRGRLFVAGGFLEFSAWSSQKHAPCIISGIFSFRPWAPSYP